MTAIGRRKSVVFIVIGVFIAVIAVALNIGWIVVSWRTGMLFVAGLLLFCIVIAGIILNTIFLVREIRRNEQHDAFINAVTHELKTPVTSIRLYLETLLAREVDEARRKEFYGTMLEDSDRLLGTINQVLDAARSGGQHLRRQTRTEVDMVNMVSECLTVARRRHHLEESRLRLSVDVAEGHKAVVSGHQEELEAALMNLLDNAVKYSAKNVLVDVDVAMPQDYRTVLVRVRDHGIGIPANQLKLIFKRFYRIPEGLALRVKGTGLGLFIVRSVVERHGGRTWAASDGSGLGSTFFMELPAAPEGAEVDAAAEGTPA
jgi:two-component system, OmpR family, sensor histidine kinase SenX3